MNLNQNKSETKTTGRSSLARMMATRDKDKLKSQKANTTPPLLREPRSQEYIKLLQRLGELSGELEDLELVISELEAELSEETGFTETPEIGEAHELRDIQDIRKEQPSWITDVMVMPQNRLQQIEEAGYRLEQLKLKREAMLEELQKTYDSFLDQLPKAEKALGLIYPKNMVEVLIRYGMIPCVGRNYHSQEELLQQIKPQSEKEKNQWIKGDNAYEHYWSQSLLCVEIYMDTICVVWTDGDVTIVE